VLFRSQQCHQKQALLETLHIMRQKLLDSLQEQQRGEMDLVLVQHLRGNVTTVGQQIANVQVELKALEAKLEAKRQELVGARQDEETLDTLKEKEIERYRLEEAQKESSLQDDVYIARTYHQRHMGA
jgi:flagellar export protein FliJ